LYGQYTNTNVKLTPFTDNLTAYPTPAPTGANATYNLAVTDPNFKFPQIWRTNLGIDKDLSNGWLLTVEGMYTKDINAVHHRNVNLPLTSRNAVPALGATAVGDNRPIFYPLGTTATPNPAAINRINNQITNGGTGGAVVMSSVNQGYSWNVATTIAKSWNKDFSASLSYVYTDSKDVNSGGSIAASIFRDRVVVGDPNVVALGAPNFLQQHRIVASGSWKKEYFSGKAATTVSFFWETGPAGNFSYTYSGDMNGDNNGGNSDLMWVPASRDDIIISGPLNYTVSGRTISYTADQQKDDLWAYINQDTYLKSRKGNYAERNGVQLPWASRFDLRFLQDFHVKIGGKKNTIQLSWDILNLGNFISSNWGLNQTTVRPFNGANNAVALVNFIGYNASGQPTYQFAPAATPNVLNPSISPLSETFTSSFGINSRYRMQIGIRYIFN
jgi:hypothetical protein